MPTLTPTFIATNVIHAVRNRLAKFLIGKVMHVRFNRRSFGTPFTPLIAVIAEALFTTTLLLFRVNRNHRLTGMKEPFHMIVDIQKLVISIRMIFALTGFFDWLEGCIPSREAKNALSSVRFHILAD